MIVDANANCRLLKTNGEQIIYTGEIALSRMKMLIQADIAEFCRCTDGSMMMIDEEGKLKGRKRNDYATELYKYRLDRKGNELDYIVGDVFIMPGSIWNAWIEEDEEY